MLVEEALHDYLSTHPGLSALIAGRIYPLVLPQKPTLPAITYQRISGLRVRSHQGPSGLASPRFQFDAWADSYASARTVADELRRALDGFRGMMGGAPGVRVDAVHLDTDRDLYETETRRWRVQADYFVWHEEG